APVAGNVSITTPEDTATNLVVSGSDVDSTNLVFANLSGPTHGALGVLNTNTGAMTYTPATNYNGGDSFTFTVFDGSLLATGTVAITVTPVNDAPVSVNDSYNTLKNVSLNLSAPGVLGNDTDVENDGLSALLVTNVAHGTLTLNADGGFVYTPTNNYVGSDIFTYRAYDAGATGNLATVTLTILATNTPPVANNQ